MTMQNTDTKASHTKSKYIVCYLKQNNVSVLILKHYTKYK